MEDYDGKPEIGVGSCLVARPPIRKLAR